MAQYDKPRNYGFNTAVGEGVAENRNAIRAAIDADQVITAGAVVRLRLLEPMQVARYVRRPIRSCSAWRPSRGSGFLSP